MDIYFVCISAILILILKCIIKELFLYFRMLNVFF